ncbi:WD40 repeat domain-containing protein [Streptomyces sp. NPDC051555]|uniref:WD40 repeat domain-containing protein n=1 Tax=Streptomyces sp. NPDC051555 TaxID=3365657 RepID=UPI00379AD3D7
MDPPNSFDEELRAFAAELRTLRDERGHRSYRELAGRAGRSDSGIRLPVATQSDAFSGKRLLGFDTLMGLVRILYAYDAFGQEIAVPPHSAPELERWRRDWRALAALRPTPTGRRTASPEPVPAPVPAGGRAPSHGAAPAPPPVPASEPRPAPEPHPARAPAGRGNAEESGASAAPPPPPALFTPRHRLSRHAGAVWSVAFSTDGRLLATTCEDDRVRIWHTGTGKQFAASLPGTFPVLFTPEGRILVTDAGNRTTVHQFATRTLSPAGPPLVAAGAPIRMMAYAPEPALLAVLDFEGDVRLWNPASGDGAALIDSEVQDPQDLRTLVQVPDGRLLGAGHGARVWNLLHPHPGTGEPIGPRVDAPGVLALSPDGRSVAFGRADGTAGVLGTRPGLPLVPLTGHRDAIHALAFRADGRLLASTSADGTVRLWDPRTGLPAAPPLTPHDGAVGAVGAVNGVAFSPDGRLLAAAGADGTVVLYERAAPAPEPTVATRALATAVRARQPVQLPPLKVAGALVRVAFAPSGQVLAATTGGRSVLLHDPVTGRALGEALVDPPTLPWALAFTPDGGLLATASVGRSVCLRDPVEPWSGRSVETGHTGAVKKIAFSPDGRQMATGGADATVRLWDRATGQLTASLTEHTNEVVGLAYSPYGLHLASSGADGQVLLWDKHLRALVGRFGRLGGGTAWAVGFSPDGGRLAAALADGGVRFWEPLTGLPVGSAGFGVGHTGAVYDLAFSPDGELLASAGEDGRVLLWDVTSGERVGHPLTGHTGAVNGLAFSPDGTLLATAGRDGTLRRWIVGSG